MPDPKTQAYENIRALVETFRNEGIQAEAEIRTRTVFINRFFAALGWNVENRQQVVYEDKAGKSGRPDYGFYTQGVLRFFVEAKTPQSKLETDRAAAFQLRRYGWSAKLSLSILTNFQEFAVYYCLAKPDETDPSDQARLEYLRYEQYEDPTVWDFLYETFSRQAVEGGALERYIQTKQSKKALRLPRPLAVDEDFLNLMDSWRIQLAKSLHQVKNLAPSLTQDQFNQAVQRTIDRIIFLRVAEDRGIDPWGLEELSKPHQSNLYQALLDIFRRADTRYNSGLFYFSPRRDRSGEADTLASQITFSDQVLQSILRGFYEKPYRFDVIPADILGSVYERFLGKLIVRQNGHIEVQEKPEVRRAGAVYYTPKYIVDYIVAQTLGKLLPGPEAAKGPPTLSLVDPACGSGSFLIAAYQYLLDWYLDFYRQQPKNYRSQLLSIDNDFQLSLKERKRILLAHIYGVDIDPQAVEVAKLNLLLKVLEVKRGAMLEQQALLREHILPELEANIQCGNSLIGTDYATEQTPQAEKERLFDWEVRFREVMAAGGFDVVIGNPPYDLVFNEKSKKHLEDLYPEFKRNNDLYAAFVTKAMEVTKKGGLHSFIIPNTYIRGPYFTALKQKMRSEADIISVLDFGNMKIFPNVEVFTSIYLLKKTEQVHSLEFTIFSLINSLESFPHQLKVDLISSDTLETLIWTPTNSDSLGVRLAMQFPNLGKLALVKDIGLNYWTKGREKVRGNAIAARVLYQGDKRNPGDIPYLKGRDIGRYGIRFGDNWLKFDYQAYLNPDVDVFRFSPKFLRVKKKLLYRQTSSELIATLDTSGYLVDKTLHVILWKDPNQAMQLEYLLGIFNSRLLNYLYQNLAEEKGRAFAQVKTFRTKQLPIRTIDPANPADVQAHEQMVVLVNQMLDLQAQLATKPDDSFLQQRVAKVDMAIDALVYQLYSLTENEIAIVEGRVP
jgi:hypothetical protein